MTISDDGFPQNEQDPKKDLISFTQEDFDALVTPEVKKPSPITEVLEALYDTIITPPEKPDLGLSIELWNAFYAEQPGSFIAMSLDSEVWGNVIERANKKREVSGKNRQLDSTKLSKITRCNFAPVGRIYASVNQEANNPCELVIHLVNGYFGLFEIASNSHILTPGNRIPASITPSPGAISLIQYGISTGLGAFEGLTKIVDEYGTIDAKLMGRMRQIIGDRMNADRQLHKLQIQNRKNFSRK